MKLFKKTDLPNVSDYKLKSLDSFRIFLFFLIGISTLGIFWIIAYWFQDILFILYQNEEDIWKADYILFKRMDNVKVFIKIDKKKCRINPFKDTGYILFFNYEGQLFHFSPSKEKFICVRNQMINYILKHPKDYNKLFNGLTKKIVNDLTQFYGKNEMDIKMNSFFLKAIQEFFLMVNLLQFLIAVGFMLLERYLYGFIVFLYIFITIILTSYEYTKNMGKLKKISESDDKIYVKRTIGREDFSGFVSVKELVIGDIVTIEPEKTFPCDMLVLKGSSLVNEALLTGESLPIIKNAYNNKINKIDSNNILFSGTKALFNRTKEVKALVIGTGWNTSKGKLIGAVVFSPKETSQYEKDFFILLLIFSIYFVAISIAVWYVEKDRDYYFFLRTLPKIFDFLKCCLPPSLIFIMTASVQLSSSKLAKKNIFTLKTKKIIEGGAIKSICFDKTGTLTRLDLNLYGYLIQENGKFENFNTNLEELYHNSNFKVFIESMSCCHGLTFYNNKILGDPIEEAMFEKVEANLKLDTHPYEPDIPINKITLSKKFERILKIKQEQCYYTLKDYEFTSNRKRMSVITENSTTKKVQIFCKGAPEIISTLCKKNTVPLNYNETLLKYSQQGFRILSIASKEIKNFDPKKENEAESIEKEMEFLGFLLFENPLKKSTAGTIMELQNNNFDVAMITGDNIYTAINVGYNSKILKPNNSLWIGTWNKKNIVWTFSDCNDNVDNMKLEGDEHNNSMISSKILSKENSSIQQNMEFVINKTTSDQRIALTGTCFEKIMEKMKDNPNIIEKILEKTSIYARSSARQKELIIIALKKKLMKKNCYVGFVGDGSNDSLALKTANIGLSIGNDEASFSASFFTSLTDISSIKEIIIEGKVCLSNSFQNFKYFMNFNVIYCFSIFYMAIYKWDYIYFDYVSGILYSLPFALFMSQGKNIDKLSFIRQNPTLFNMKFIITFVFQIFISLLVIMFSFHYLVNLETYKDWQSITSQYIKKNFIFSNFYFVQNKLIYYTMVSFSFVFVFVYYESYPFKKSIFENYTLMCWGIFILFIICINLFPEIILGFNESFYSFVKKKINIPDYNITEKNMYILFLLFNIFLLILFGKAMKILELYYIYKQKEKEDKLIIDRDINVKD